MLVMKTKTVAATAFALAAQTALTGCRSHVPQPASPSATVAPAGRGMPLSDALETQAILGAMTAVADWQLANPSAHKPYEWHQAPFWAGLYELAVKSSDRRRYLDEIRRHGE